MVWLVLCFVQRNEAFLFFFNERMEHLSSCAFLRRVYWSAKRNVLANCFTVPASSVSDCSIQLILTTVRDFQSGRESTAIVQSWYSVVHPTEPELPRRETSVRLGFHRLSRQAHYEFQYLIQLQAILHLHANKINLCVTMVLRAKRRNKTAASVPKNFTSSHFNVLALLLSGVCWKVLVNNPQH